MNTSDRSEVVSELQAAPEDTIDPEPRPEPHPSRRRTVRRWILFAVAVGLLIATLAVARTATVELLTAAIAMSPNHGLDATVAAITPLPLRGIAHRAEAPQASIAFVTLAPEAKPPRGTILFLHGIRASHAHMLEPAAAFTALGYKAVVPDLRGHGQSTGDWLTYGAGEATDLVAVLDALQEQGELVEPVGIYGGSYGAATAIQLGAIDPRVKAVVAIAPFASMREVVHAYVDRNIVGAWLPNNIVDAALEEAGDRGGFDVEDSNAAVAVARRPVPVLLLHGGDDVHIPPAHSEAIARASPGTTTLVIVEGESHGSIWSDREGIVWREASAHMERHLKPQRTSIP